MVGWRTRLLVGFGILGILTAGTAAADVVGDAGEVDETGASAPPEGVVLIVDEAEMIRQAAAMLARTQEAVVDEAHAKRILEHQAQADDVADAFRAAFPEQFAQMHHPGVGDSTVLLVKGSATTAMRELAGEDVEVQGGAKFSAEELAGQVQPLTIALHEAGYADAGVGVEVQRLVVTLPTDDVARQTGQRAASDLDLATLLERARELSGMTSLDLGESDVRLDLRDSQVALAQTHSYGGGKIHVYGDSNNYCTTGFTAYSPVYGNGVITARHCTSVTRYRENSGNEYSAPIRINSSGTYGDIEFHTTAHTEFDDFYVGWSTLWDVTGYVAQSNINVGDWYSRYGRKTGQWSAQVTSTSISRPLAWGTAYNLVQTTYSQDDLGDSGGPWFNGSGKAVGIQSGHDAPHPITFVIPNSYFSSVDRAMTGLNVTVLS
ncbi:MAG: hypothetical protein GY925_13855 [Actinomycetia bacterium]|nr:hypothetical protein [Actinomycetes bacterium]